MLSIIQFSEADLLSVYLLYNLFSGVKFVILIRHVCIICLLDLLQAPLEQESERFDTEYLSISLVASASLQTLPIYIWITIHPNNAKFVLSLFERNFEQVCFLAGYTRYNPMSR